MSILVQKFGGTSVADSEKILAAARKAILATQRGYQVVMVVSAMGKNTDMLVQLASEITDSPSDREMDMLLSTGEQVSVALMAMAIHSLGHRAVSLTGGQIGIRTDSKHTKARIRSISTDRMRSLLDQGQIVIAAGFQGIDEDLNITTLGRGGSDTTAVALAAVLSADACEIYTDVQGVYTTDPRIVPEAHRVPVISYDEMLELASLGAGVMHSRSIEFAKKFNVPIHVRSSFLDAPGTLIVDASPAPSVPVVGAALNRKEARITIRDIPDVPGTIHTVFSEVAAQNISVDMIVQNIGVNGLADLSFTVPQNELQTSLDSLQAILPQWAGASMTHDENVAKISVVGAGMRDAPGVAERMFSTLGASNINIHMITTSEIKISVLVSGDQAIEGLRTIHRAFQLDAVHQADSSGRELPPRPPERSTTQSADIVSSLRLADMEELTISRILLDETQGRITIQGIPDQPGIAHRMFAEVAAAGISVDMIVQSSGESGHAALSFTVDRHQVQKCVEVAKSLAASMKCRDVTSSPKVAKLTVVGIGLRSHTGVAIRMFHALADANINVLMINTSEVQVNVIVDSQLGAQAKACLEAAFGDVMD